MSRAAAFIRKSWGGDNDASLKLQRERVSVLAADVAGVDVEGVVDGDVTEEQREAAAEKMAALTSSPG
ncbi:hypothetical protein DJ71_19495 [Halorubrum sp. E3]|uniref:hypothetical protein n=1 Tax=Halorubrum persicum TaxID=1383844 RepID=UPI000BD15BF5|nr:hypothetical protein [Halorubrum persicum]OYR73595.1 hypothetical protein DJ71_19495 [Halorubrum sp. E3]